MDGVEREVEHRETSDGIKENKWTHEGRKGEPLVAELSTNAF